MFHLGLENNSEGRSQVWVLGHPGCFAYGADGPGALQGVPQALRDYRDWIAAHTAASWLVDADAKWSLEETWDCYTIDDQYELAPVGYEVNAWFRHDWLPLNAEEIERGLLLLGWGRQEMMKTVGDLSSERLDRTYPAERWSISGILSHIGGAEWWYLDRLGLIFPRSEVPDDPFQRLDRVRSHLVEILPGLAGATQVVGISGEFWSPRKLLRRAVWHEYDHLAHIRKLL
jgi:hypothetical protein